MESPSRSGAQGVQGDKTGNEVTCDLCLALRGKVSWENQIWIPGLTPVLVSYVTAPFSQPLGLFLCLPRADTALLTYQLMEDNLQ